MGCRCLQIVFTAVLIFGATVQAQTVGLELGLVQARAVGGAKGSGRRIAFDLLDRFAPYGRDLLSFVSQRLLSRGTHADGVLQEEEIDSKAIEAVWQFMWPATYRWHPWFGVESVIRRSGASIVTRSNAQATLWNGCLTSLSLVLSLSP